MDKQKNEAIYIIGFAAILIIFSVSTGLLISSGCLSRNDVPTSFNNVLPHSAKFKYHTVKENETLWRIARIYGVPLKDIAEINSIFDPTQIRVGTVLKIPAETHGVPAVFSPDKPESPFSSSENIKFDWPLKGNISRHFSQGEGKRHDGIDIRAKEGTPIRAAEDGRVVYSGDEFEGYGLMIIIEHSNGLSTIYAHCSQLLVYEGDEVTKGHIIARVGRTGRATGPHLHFEVRNGNRPLNPISYLPPR